MLASKVRKRIVCRVKKKKKYIYRKQKFHPEMNIASKSVKINTIYFHGFTSNIH